VPRLYKRKRVPILSSDGTYDSSRYVDIPVIAEIDLLGSLGQEFRYRFHNDSTTQLRTVRVKRVPGVEGSFGNTTVSTDSYANVERIQTMAFSSPVEQPTFMGKPVLGHYAWRTDKKLKNLDPAPKQPDGSDDPRHLEVHYVRFYKDNNIDGDLWVDTELIDKIELLATNAQEYVYRLRWPTADDYAVMAGNGNFGQGVGDDDPYQPIIGFCPTDIDLLDVEFGEDGNPLPTRTDPFQNICNIGAEEEPPAGWYGLRVSNHQPGGLVSSFYNWGFDGPLWGSLGEWPIPPPPPEFGNFFYSAGTLYIKASELTASALAAQQVAHDGFWPGGAAFPGGPQEIPAFERVLWRAFPSPGITDSPPLNAFPVLNSFINSMPANYSGPTPIFQFFSIPDDDWDTDFHSGIHDPHDPP
jgi:hypothetical protein